jgi:hypothetical protein
MAQNATYDWWVLGCDPVQGHLLVKCRLTEQTGVVKDATAEELLAASAKNFAPHPWVEPERVTVTLLKPQVIHRAKQSQRISPIIARSQSLASRHTE